MLIKWANLTIEQILVDGNTTFSMARFERKRLEKIVYLRNVLHLCIREQ
jgi:hypothetical protein